MHIIMILLCHNTLPVADACVSLSQFVGWNKIFFSANHVFGYNRHVGASTAHNMQHTLKVHIKPAKYYDIKV